MRRCRAPPSKPPSGAWLPLAPWPPSAPQLRVSCPFSSARLGDDVDQRRLAALDDGDRAPERGRELGRIADRAFAMDPIAARHGGVIDVRILERRADIRSGHAAAA